MKKKILFMINSMNVGGAEKSLSSLLSLFDYERYDVYLQEINRGGEFEGLIPDEVTILPPIPFFEFSRQSIKRQMFSRNLRFIPARLKTAFRLRRNNRLGHKLHDTQAFWQGARDAFDMLPDEYDVAIAWGQGTPTHFVAEKVNAKKKIAWINADYEAVGHNKDFDNAIYGRYSCIVGVSEPLSDKLRAVFPQYADRVRTVHDINSAVLINRMAGEQMELPAVHGTAIATLGRLTKQKGYDIAVEAAGILKNRGKDFTWLVCGDGGERKSIENQIQKYALEKDFLLLGSKPNPYPYLNMADIYVQTSKFEGYCIALTEARILNKPCVTTRFDVVYDQMVDGENGLVVDMTPQAVADGICRLMEDKALYCHIQQYQQNEKKGNEEEIDKIYRMM